MVWNLIGVVLYLALDYVFLKITSVVAINRFLEVPYRHFVGGVALVVVFACVFFTKIPNMAAIKLFLEDPIVWYCILLYAWYLWYMETFIPDPYALGRWQIKLLNVFFLLIHNPDLLTRFSSLLTNITFWVISYLYGVMSGPPWVWSTVITIIAFFLSIYVEKACINRYGLKLSLIILVEVMCFLQIVKPQEDLGILELFFGIVLAVAYSNEECSIGTKSCSIIFGIFLLEVNKWLEEDIEYSPQEDLGILELLIGIVLAAYGNEESSTGTKRLIIFGIFLLGVYKR